MAKVYEVSSPNHPATRLHLPDSSWGQTVRERLTEMGYTVRDTGCEPTFPDCRDAAELARRDELLEWAAPD